MLLFGSFVPALLATECRYTWCLLVFLVPGSVALLWTLHKVESKRAWLRVWAGAFTLLLPLGWALGFLLGGALFTYDAPDQVLGIDIAAPLPTGGTANVPVEEFAFYVTGFAAIAAQYLWGCHVLFPTAAPAQPAMVTPLPYWLPLVWLVVVALLIVLLQGTPKPLYCAFLVATNGPLLAWGWPVMRHHVHRSALLWTLGSTLVVSIIWEAFLALSEGWWGYRSEWLLGLYFGDSLPVEAVAVWLLAPIACSLMVTVLALRAGLWSRPRT